MSPTTTTNTTPSCNDVGFDAIDEQSPRLARGVALPAPHRWRAEGASPVKWSSSRSSRPSGRTPERGPNTQLDQRQAARHPPGQSADAAQWYDQMVGWMSQHMGDWDDWHEYRDD
jgi:hypothetical protein